MKLDAIGVLFGNSWRRLREKFAPAIQIFFIPLILIFISQLLFIHNTAFAILLGGIIEFLATIVSIIASIALISLFGKGTDVAGSYHAGFKLFWSAIWIGILASLAVLGGSILLIVPGIMLAIQLGFTSYALVLENKHGMGALTQSREYVKGYWWAVLGRLLLLLLCFIAGMLILFLPAALLFGSVFAEIVYAVLLLIFVPFSASYEYEIYENFRRLKPDVTVAQKSSEGFLKVAMVLGIIGAIFLVVSLAVGAVFFPGAMIQWQTTHSGSYHYVYPPTTGVEGPTGNQQTWISPVSGSVGTWITITGSNFSATNTILMKGLVAAKDVAPSADGTLGFAIPGTLGPNCNPGQVCPDFLLAVTAGDYPITVVNSRDTISAGGFVVTGNPVNSGTSSGSPIKAPVYQH